MNCPTGKRAHRTYADALAALNRVVADPLTGSVYTCQTCGEFHISKRRFTLDKAKGRGKRRRGPMVRWA